MYRTKELLHGAFGRDLGNLIYALFEPPRNTSIIEIGGSGCWELCVNKSWGTHLHSIAYRALIARYTDIMFAIVEQFEVPFKWNDALWGVCSRGYADLIQTMLDHGATDIIGALYGARYGNQLEVATILLTYEYELDNWRDERLIEWLKSYGLHPNTSDEVLKFESN